MLWMLAIKRIVGGQMKGQIEEAMKAVEIGTQGGWLNQKLEVRNGGFTA